MKPMHRFSLLVFCVNFSLVAVADPKRYYVERYLQKQEGKRLRPRVPEAWYEQKLDHFADDNTRTFKQRYYVDSSLASGLDAPVLLYICGEATCDSTSLTNGAIRTYAQQLGAHLVALEHRYYGETQPFATLATENLKYLSTPQAVEDLATFQVALTKQKQWTGKWVAFGGSYPGSLAAYYRNKHPELVVGALASSAPVKAKEDFWEYDAHVTKVAGPACAAKMRDVVRYAEQSLDNPEALAKLKAAFAADIVKDSVDFLYVIADTGAFAVQYGLRDQFCNALTHATDPVKAYGDFAKLVFARYGFQAVSTVAQGAESLDPKDYLASFGMRQWLYQSCTEYGYWQNAAPVADQSSRSGKINLAYHRNVCKRLFNLETPVNTDFINTNYFAPLFDETSARIVFSNGSQDPWSNLSVTSAEIAETEGRLSYLVVEGGAHCDDLRAPRFADSESLVDVRQSFFDDMKAWLQ